MAVTTFSFLAFFTTLLLSSPVISTVHFNYPAIFNFGDSNSDTGCVIAAGIGGLLDPPYGQTYFHEPSGRFSDGRLIIDFLSHAMDKRFLNAYLESVGVPNFRRGANFAAAGSTILPPTQYAFCPFSFGNQVAQFFSFKARVLQLLGGKLDKFVPREDYFRKGLYTFDIGQNDLAGAFYSKTEDQVIASIPTILQEFENGTKKLYDQGARNFWIHNTGPLGCLPQNLFVFGKEKSDKHGCLRPHNHAARVFNLQLLALCRKLQHEFADARITYVDIFSIKFDLISNFSRYGFEHPTTACCGYGGPPLNYDSRISCGQTKVLNGTTVTAKGCDDFTKYVSWDGIHYTEAANHHVWSQIPTGKYSYPLFSEKI
ncbi:GDSL esterase/lipase-like protein [Cinnamomum micranthum f. kanehirae]|uniref:GDSL esterase/lipase-like protein n=1 Tax=Cinnamomum micranthum f. kanehirae TaxID=337451 RepID=A0A3S3N4G5_9MAGN|nr:GDSL esterase/lipase-like protein [Cinnamomum micranthum f. kanehirae]